MKTRAMFCAAVVAMGVVASLHTPTMTVPVKEDKPALQYEVIRMGAPKEKAASTCAIALPEKESTVEITDTPVPKSDWFTIDFMNRQVALKEYADTYATFDFHGTTIDGLAIMAQANCESSYMCNPSKSLSALYPTTFVEYDSIDDLETLGIDKVWASTDALNGTYVDKPGWSIKAGPYYAWTSGDGIYEQGPLQTRVSKHALEALEGYQSEKEKLIEAGLWEQCVDTLYGVEATSLVTGSEYLDHKLGYVSNGDRWAIADNCIMYREAKSRTLETLWDSYYKDCGYTPNKYELLGIISYCHWVPGVIRSDTSLDTIRYYGFAYDGAWFDLTHQIASEEGIEVIREYVHQKIDANRELLSEGYTKEECYALLKLSIRAGSTSDPAESEPWTIFNTLVEKGVVDEDAVILHPEYGYQHAMKYAIQYLFSYIMLEELLINNY